MNLTVQKLIELEEWARNHAINPEKCDSCKKDFYVCGNTTPADKCPSCGGFFYPEFARRRWNDRFPIESGEKKDELD